MRRVLILVLVFAVVFAVSCSSKKKENLTPEFEEQVSKEIKAEEGGKIESSDGKTAIEVPAGALDDDTTITMTIYESEGYKGTEDVDVITKIVEFEPSGIVFKKPVIITMASESDVDKKIVSAAVYNESKGKWSYDEHGAYALLLQSKDEEGAPVLTTAGGDPIMLNAGGDPIMMSAGGDPIMLAAAGDPIMLSSAGDPIMTNAAGDPIMNAAAGDPIMMTTGHFTAYTFIMLTPKEYVEPGDSDNEPAEKDDDEPVDDGDSDSEPARPDGNEPVDDSDTDTTEPDGDGPLDDTDIAEPDGDTEPADDDVISEPDGDTEPVDDDVVSEPELVYSKVLCTGKSICNDDNNQILCPAEGEDFYGQDAQYAARKGCIPHSYTTLPKPEEYNETDYIDQVHDNVTGLTWIIDMRERRLSYMNQTEDPCGEEYSEYSYLGSGWRLPTTKEVMTLADHGILYDALIDQTYFSYLSNIWTAERFIYQIDEGLVYGSYDDLDMALMWCVRGEEYGKVGEDTYEIFGEGNEKVVFDSSTNLIWQKEYAENKTWEEALSYCENLEYAGKGDWRLPNKNELMTLVDLSKEEGPFSSFPDMPADGFWSSTAYDYFDSYNKVLSDGYAWVTHFEGFVTHIPFFVDEKMIGDYPFPVESGNAVFSVRCVRSALDEKEEIPECDGSGIGSCRDASSGIVWSSRLYPEIFSSAVYTGEDYGSGYGGSGYGYGGIFFTAVMCRNLNENGSNKWRIPTIDELRTIIMDEDLKTAGDCGYYETSDCESLEPSKTALNDFGVLVSGSMQGEGSDWPMFYAFDVRNGNLPVIWDPPVSELVVRCVYDEGLDFKSAPYTDPDTGFTWSEMSQTVLTWEEAQDFCSAMNYDDQEHYWRLPTSDELETLNKAGKGTCTKYGNSGNFCFSGEYSIFGDIEEFWTGQDCGNGHVNFNFWEYTGYCYQNGEVDIFKARCVSDSPSPCAGDPCAGIDHATGCVPESAEEYSCACEEGYFWAVDECQLEQS